MLIVSYIFLVMLFFVILSLGAPILGKIIGEKAGGIIDHIILSFILAITAMPLTVEILYSTEFSYRKENLSSRGYYYTKFISDDEKSNISYEDDSYLTEICGNNNYEIVDKRYNRIEISSHIFIEEDVYLYCRDFNKHRNSDSFTDINDYNFSEKFPEYPSSQAILKFCDLDSALVVNKELEPLKGHEPMLYRNYSAYLYCKK